MLRNVLAVLAGLVVGMVVNIAVMSVNSVLFPMPAGIDPSDTAQMGEYVGSLPLSALLIVMVAHLGQAFVGGLVAARLGASHRVVLAVIVGVLALVGGVANMMMVPHPTWMWIEAPLYLLVAWAAGTLVERRMASTDEELPPDAAAM